MSLCAPVSSQMFIQCLWEFMSAKGKMLFAPRMDAPGRDINTEGVGVDNATLVKFVSAVPGLTRTRAFKRQLDLIHARHTSHGKRGLTRHQLGQALIDVAKTRFGKKKVIAFRRARGVNAQVLMLVFEFVKHVRVAA